MSDRRPRWPLVAAKRIFRLAYGDSWSDEARVSGSIPVFGSNGPIGVHNLPNTEAPVIIVGRKGSCGRLQYVGDRVFSIDTTYFVDGRFTRVDLKWLFYALTTLDLHTQSQDTAVPGLSREAIYGARLPLPPSSEQRAIADFLDLETAALDSAIGKCRALTELLDAEREAFVDHVVSRGLDDGAVFERTASVIFSRVPAHWCFRRLKRLLKQVVRPVRVDPDGMYAEIGVRSWGKGVFHKDPMKGSVFEDKALFHVAPGDLVLNIVFAWEGAVAVVTEREAGMVASHRFPTFKHADEVMLDYLLLVLRSEHGRALMGINSPGAAGRNRTIRLGQFLDEQVPLPPLSEQRQITEAVRSVELRAERLRQKIDRTMRLLYERRSALISAAVSGEINVRRA